MVMPGKGFHETEEPRSRLFCERLSERWLPSVSYPSPSEDLQAPQGLVSDPIALVIEHREEGRDNGRLIRLKPSLVQRLRELDPDVRARIGLGMQESTERIGQ